MAGFMGLAVLGLLLPATVPETAVLEGDQLSTDLRAIVESLNILELKEGGDVSKETLFDSDPPQGKGAS